MLLIEDRTYEDFAHWRYNRLSPAPLSPAWNDSGAPEAMIHRIHAYPAKFPSFLVHKALDHARREGVEVRRVADVFCGSGTVTYEAAALNLEAWGCDINPVATLIARVKVLGLDPIRFTDAAGRIAQAFGGASDVPPLSPAAVARLSPWYEPSQFDDLAKLRNAMLSEVGGEGGEAMAFACAFSAVLKPASRWRSRSVKPSRDLGRRGAPVLETFRRRCAMMAAAWCEAAAPADVAPEIVQGDVVAMRRSAPPVDLIVTSPPYAVSYEYADLHQLSALWLGFVDDHRDLRAGVIGTISRRADLAAALRDLNGVGVQIVFGLFDRDRALAEATATYFLDMQKVARRCHDFLRPGGMAVFVVGNTQLRGVRVDNANHLVESLLEAGFADVRVVRRRLENKPNTPYRSADGRLSSSRADMRIYGEEYVLMARRR